VFLDESVKIVCVIANRAADADEWRAGSVVLPGPVHRDLRRNARDMPMKRAVSASVSSLGLVVLGIVNLLLWFAIDLRSAKAKRVPAEEVHRDLRQFLDRHDVIRVPTG
jgi:hypothetical protein